jgi:hypothetical protein
MSFQGSNPFAEQATNIPVFFQSMTAESSMSSQGFDPSVRKKIKRTNADFSPSIAGTSSQDSGFAASSTLKLLPSNIFAPKGAASSEAQQAQSKNADTACSKRVCMKINGRKLNINGRIISIGSKEFVFFKLLFEKINTYVPVDDLYVAAYRDRAGDWKKDSKKERKRFYFLLSSLRKKLPESCFKDKASLGYMLSDSSEAFESEEGSCNFQKIQYGSKNYPLIGDCYTNDYATICRGYTNLFVADTLMFGKV